ncbi:hypothetical protein [Lysinibacillus sp. NPDC086135]|uniref:hypothetical protein n=1 Tax=Lysinibacillus sp. NPDC086135 TaxID=3364130 RepID=UPI0038191F12
MLGFLKRNLYIVDLSLSDGRKVQTLVKAYSIHGAGAKMADIINKHSFLTTDMEIVPRAQVTSFSIPRLKEDKSK